MTVFDYIIAAFAILGVSLVWLRLADLWDQRSVARCIRRIGLAECPRCKQILGADVASTANGKFIKFGTGSGRRLRGRDYPRRLFTVVCPRCSAELEFRLDGSLFSCDHEVVAEPGAAGNSHRAVQLTGL
jgi:hypothetical protein